MKYKATIRTKTLVELKKFYEQALNPRYCINGIYHIKTSNWFKSGSPIWTAVDKTLNHLFEKITPVEYQKRDYIPSAGYCNDRIYQRNIATIKVVGGIGFLIVPTDSISFKVR